MKTQLKNSIVVDYDYGCSLWVARYQKIATFGRSKSEARRKMLNKLKVIKKEKPILSKKKYHVPTSEYYVTVVVGGYQANFKREIEQYPSITSPVYKYKKDAYEWCYNNYNAKQQLLDKYIEQNWRRK